MKIEIKTLPGSEIEISGEVPAVDFESERERAVKELSEGVNIPGFRPGNIPEKVLVEKMGEHAVLEKMAEILLQKVYPKIIAEHRVSAVGRPEITILKIAKDNPLEFKIKTAVIPKIKLPDYKEIAKKINEKKEEITVDEKEVERTIEHLLKTRASKNDKGKEVLPELNDDFAKELGGFKGLDDMKEKIKENLLAEKKTKAREKKRLEILDKIIELLKPASSGGSQEKIEIPKILIEAEKNKILQESKAGISQMGLKWEDYLKHLKKTEEDVLSGWEESAIKRIKHGLALNEIAAVEKVEIPEEDLKTETQKIVDYYKNAGQDIDQNRVKDYTYGILRNEKIFKLLESC